MEYYVIDRQHSFCSHAKPGAIDQPIEPFERQRIVEMHNEERRLVRGSNMQKMVHKILFFFYCHDLIVKDFIVLE